MPRSCAASWEVRGCRGSQGARTSRAMSEKSLDVEDSRAAAWFTMPLVSSSLEELASMALRSRLAHTPSSQTGKP